VTPEAADRIARHFPTAFLRGYARGKLRSDPLYTAVVDRLRDDRAPLFDIGSGLGLLAFCLREEGLSFPVRGIDHDQAKVSVARDVARHYSGLLFEAGDVRDGVPGGMNVAALDVLHYFTSAEQERVLETIAEAVPPGGVAVIRDAVRDRSLRYRLTAAQETFSRLIRWLKAERLNFPTAEQIAAPFRRRGFAEEIVPMWGKTPFNNYLFVFRRPTSGTTRE
jgi:SAM-dependent methyltransferase